MVNIHISKSKMINSKVSAFVSFNYNEDIIREIKLLNERYFNPTDKTWEINVNDINMLQLMLPKETFNIKEYEPELFHIPNGYKFKSEPMTHQIEAVNYLLNNKKAIIGDEQGLGKSAESLYAAKLKKDMFRYKHTLIICCVNKLKWNWVKEVEQHTDEKAYVLGTRYTKKGKVKPITSENKIEDLNNFEELSDSYFIITNIESFRDEKITQLVKRLCLSNEIGMIIVDEIHKCKNPSTKMGKNFMSLSADSEVALSGTILINNPIDLYIPLKWIGVENTDYWYFQTKYVKYKKIKKAIDGGKYKTLKIPIGYKNLGELQRKVGDFSLRRKKEEVLDLPEKIYKTEILEMEEDQANVYDEIYFGRKNQNHLINVCENPLEKFTRLRQVTSDPSLITSKKVCNCKLERLQEIVEETVLNKKKIIIFSNWESVVNKCVDMFKEYNPAKITGSTVDTEKEKNKFQNDDSCSVIVGTIGAMGTGHTLTAANTVVFIESPWTAADKVQAEDRAHRIGTKESVYIIDLICKDTVDEKVAKIVEDKREINNLVIESKYNGQSTIEYLLS